MQGRLTTTSTRVNGSGVPLCVTSDEVFKSFYSHDFLEEYERFSLREHRVGLESARGVAGENHKRFLYKYRSLNSGGLAGDDGKKSLRKARSLLVENRIWMAGADKLNDPHDCLFNVVSNPSANDRKRWVKENSHLLPPMSPAKRMRRMAELQRAQLGDHMIEGFRRSLLQGMGIFCASETPRSTVLWTHYGDEHKGYCVQLATYADPLLSLAQRVNYEDSYPEIVIPAGVGHKNEHYLYKAPEWAYEREFRIVLPKNDFEINLRPEAVAGVVFGFRAKDDTVDAILKLLDEREDLGMPPVRRYKAYLPARSFGIRLASI